jgi:hypothetical protein
MVGVINMQSEGRIAFETLLDNEVAQFVLT